MMPKYVSAFLICFIAGVALGSLYIFGLSHILVGVTAIVLGGLLLALVFPEIGLLAIAAVIGLAFGLGYVNLSFADNQYVKFIGTKIDTEGVVVADPVTVEKNQQITLRLDGFTQDIRTQLYTPIPDIQKGDRVWVRGQLELPENFSDFDYTGYLQRWNIYAVLKKPRLIVIRRAGFSWRSPLLAIRTYVIEKSKAFPANEGSLIVGMLIGQRQNIPKDVSAAFKTTGLTHIVAVSGFNMTIIAAACGTLVWYLGRRATNLLTLVIVAGFVVITGASAAVVRAGIMSNLMVTGQLLGRQYSSSYSLLLVAALMVIHNPRIVMWDVGFQLSVAATYGVLASFQTQKPDAKPGFFSELMRPTMGAIAMTSPIIIYHFGTFSLIAPVANLLVLPFVPWIMLLGALSLLPLVGSLFTLPAQLITSAVLGISKHLSHIPYASVEVNLPAWSLGTYYVLVLWFIYKRQSSASLQNQDKDAKL